MIVGETVDVMVERVDAGRRANAGLPHRSAEALFPAPDVIDEGARSRDDAADRRAEAFREIDPGRIPTRGHVARRYSGRDAGVQQPRAIHVGDEPVCLGDRHHFIERRLLPDRAAADIGGLLDADDGLRRLVTRARVQRCAKRFGGELPVVARQRRDLESAERRMRAAFAGNDMRAGMGQDFIARPAMDERRRDVAHGPRRHEHGRFLAKQFGHALAQQIYRRIIADLLVANFRPRHRLAHRWCRARLRVRQQVDADGLGLGIARGRGVVHGEFFLAHIVTAAQKHASGASRQGWTRILVCIYTLEIRYRSVYKYS